MKLIYILIAVFIFSCTLLFAQMNKEKINQEWKTDIANKSVPLNEFTVLLKRDGIPPIDNPKFWNKELGDKVFFKHEPVIAVAINGKAKAYPLSILTWHEIVNDRIGGVPISATYCPLCNAAIVFDRKLNFKGKEYLLDFGVSGMLRKSDMVMWDRQTETWWQQFMGEGLVGELKGAQLNVLPSMLISYEEFFRSYPDGSVLSTETGHNKEYGKNPYVNYDDLSNEKPRFFKEGVDPRLPAMERVININVKGIDRIYPLSVIQKKRVINDNPHNEPIVLFYQKGTVSVMDKNDIKSSKDIGAVTVFVPIVKNKRLTFMPGDKGFIDKETNSVWNITGRCIEGKYKGEQLEPVVHGNHFAFAWFAFKPDCEVYSLED